MNVELSVDGFTLVRNDRTANKGGGIIIYLKKSLRFMFRPLKLSPHISSYSLEKKTCLFSLL